MNPTVAIVIAFIIGLAFGIAIMALALERRSKRLRNRFGPEYERVLTETGDRRTAETVLERREHRVRQLHLQSLSPADRVEFQDRWRQIQTEFVDDPSRALAQADRLTGEVMSAEGYPVREFDERAAGADRVRQIIQLLVAAIAEDEPLFGVEHAEALRHIVQSRAHAPVLHGKVPDAHAEH